MTTVFSVIVPIFNVEKYLEACIESVLHQTYSNYELILVDDGSTDKCPKICDEYAKTHKEIKVIHKKNGGLVSARNAGIKAAKGDYICYLDGDDTVSERLLETVYNKGILNNHSDVIIYGIEKCFTDHRELVTQTLRPGFYNRSDMKKEIFPYIMYDKRRPFCNGIIFPAACNKAIRRSLLIEHYCKDERIRMGEDNAFTFECVYFANSLTYIAEPLYFYNKTNENSITYKYDPNRFLNNAYLTNYIKSHLGGINRAMDKQINAFNAYWLIMAVFHEVKCKRPIFQSANHIKKEIAKHHTLNDIKINDLPKSASLYIRLLQYNMYFTALLGARFINSIRKSN